MKRTGPFAAATMVLLAACQNVGAPASGNRMLINAGFVARKPTTTKQTSLYGALPANQMVKQSIRGKVNYLYADPGGCNCVYVGTRTAFQNYRGMQNTMALMTQEPSSINMIAPGLTPDNIDDVSGWAPM